MQNWRETEAPVDLTMPVFSALLGYLTRPYILYDSWDPRLGSRRPRRGWERVGGQG